MAEKDLAALVSEAREARRRQRSARAAIEARRREARAPDSALVDAWQDEFDNEWIARGRAMAELDRLIDGGT